MNLSEIRGSWLVSHVPGYGHKIKVNAFIVTRQMVYCKTIQDGCHASTCIYIFCHNFTRRRVWCD